jgi:anti-anti-sigma factor
MTNDVSTRPERAAKARRKHSSSAGAETAIGTSLIQVERSGEWMPAEELWEAALAALVEGKDVTVDLDRVDHLDASALQILLALDVELKNGGHKLRLKKASERLRKWFDFAGVDEEFFEDRQKSDA